MACIRPRRWCVREIAAQLESLFRSALCLFHSKALPLASDVSSSRMCSVDTKAGFRSKNTTTVRRAHDATSRPHAHVEFPFCFILVHMNSPKSAGTESDWSARRAGGSFDIYSSEM
ncbi:unnamed protein product [Protopolystoma xenopodis]|uniref:Uncharacterized protein n=1 Tax=Protopolystoma xenopodis TaxID=117903 RepID=A0A3S5AIA8_9PLAT|nr:unnamed protein product [Protopolystoma xenopodis]